MKKLPKRLNKKKPKLGFRYIEKKGFERGGKQEKTESEKFLTFSQVQAMLNECPRVDKIGIRDHAIILLSFIFGLRSEEAIIMKREAFRKIDQGVAYIRRVKNRPRIPFRCTHCEGRCNVKPERIGEEFQCIRCGKYSVVQEPKKTIVDEDPEKEVTLIEDYAIKYIKNYLKEEMEPNQDYLFVKYYKNGKFKSDEPLSTRHVRRIFSTYAEKAGLGKIYSTHCLRHARGVYLWEKFKDLVTIAKGLGHSSLKNAEIYIGMSPEARQSKLSTLNEENPFSI